MRKLTLFACISGLLLSLFACTEKLKTPDTNSKWQPELAFPIGKDTLKMVDEITGARNLHLIPAGTDIPSYSLRDSSYVNFSNMLDDDNIVTKLVFNLSVNSEVPFDLKTELFLTDKAGTVLKTIYVPAFVIKKGIFDAAGFFQKSTLSRSQVTLQQSELDIMQEVRYAKFVFTFDVDDVDRAQLTHLVKAKLDYHLSSQIHFSLQFD